MTNFKLLWKVVFGEMLKERDVLEPTTVVTKVEDDEGPTQVVGT